jgi:TonB family protein
VEVVTMRRLRSVAGIGLAAGALAIAPLRAQDTPAPGTLAGTVRDSAGALIAGAEVTVAGTGLRAYTTGQGEFRLTNVPSGSVTVGVRRLGFSPALASIVIAPNQAAVVVVVVTPLAQALAQIVVRGDRRFEDYGRMAGFYQRKSRSSGGHFITREQIDQRNPAQLTDLFRSVPGARIHSSTFNNVVRFRGMRCAPLVWLDGFPATAGEFDLDALDPYIVEGVEVYLGIATVPPEFRWVRGGGSCGAIVIWTGFEQRRRKQRLAATPPTELAKQIDEGRLFTADQVDVVARPDSGASVRPAYPDSLYRQHVTGQVLVEFIVDTTGLVVSGSASAISSTHALFTEAVRRALRDARFYPATIGGRKVRQLVLLPVKFELPVQTSSKP